MTWDCFVADWPAQIDRVLGLFPETDRCALVRFRGNLAHLVQYIADTHDLTRAEAADLIECRLLPGARHGLALAA